MFEKIFLSYVQKYCWFVVLFIALGSSMAYGQSEGSFTGNWTANGSRQLKGMAGDSFISTYTLAGHVQLHDGIGDSKDFWSECYGVGGSETGSETRCVWKDLHGNGMILSLQGKQFKEETLVSGSILSGSGIYQGIAGSLSFKWSTMILGKRASDLSISGYVSDMQGTYILP